MKILHVINIGGYGGAEKLLLQLLPELSRNTKIECAVFYQQSNNNAALDIGNRLRQSGIDVYFYSYKRWFSGKNTTYLAKLINDQKYDLVHGHLKYADAWLSQLKRRKHIAVPVVSTLHGYNDKYENRFGFAIKRQLYFSIYYQVSRYIYTQLDGFILISNIVDQFYKRSGLISGKKKKRIIYHGYKIPDFVDIPRDAAPGHPYHVAIPGRLIRRKGHRYLLDAVKELKEQGTNVKVHIYGQGEEEGELRKHSETLGLGQEVIFHGYVDNLVEAISQMDAVAIPSLWEGFGLVFLDSFAAKVPVVAFDLPAANEIIKHEFNGLLARPASATSLAENIHRVLKDDRLKQQICDNASRELHEQYSIKRMADNYIMFYKEFCNE